MPDIDVTIGGVHKLLSCLNPNKARAPTVLKTLANKIAPILTVIFQLSLNSGNVPSDWRQGNTAPIFKKRWQAQAVKLPSSIAHFYLFQTHWTYSCLKRQTSSWQAQYSSRTTTSFSFQEIVWNPAHYLCPRTLWQSSRWRSSRCSCVRL